MTSDHRPDANSYDEQAVRPTCEQCDRPADDRFCESHDWMSRDEIERDREEEADTSGRETVYD